MSRLRQFLWTPLCVIALAIAVYLPLVFTWDYSTGERAGWVQKLSKKGWLCKTWEGELAMVSLPGVVPEKFLFTVKDDAVAEEVNALMGQRVTLHYEQKVGIPTTCFGDTMFWVNQIEAVSEIPLAPGIVVPESREPTRTGRTVCRQRGLIRPSASESSARSRDPSRHGRKEVFPDGLLQPRVVSTPIPLPIFQLGNEGLQARADHRTRMGIDRTVQHQDGGTDRGKGRRVDPFPLQPEHVVPGFLIRPTVHLQGFRLDLGRDQLERIQRPHQVAHDAKPVIFEQS